MFINKCYKEKKIDSSTNDIY